MKKTGVILTLIFTIALMFSACDKIEKNNYVEQPKLIVAVESKSNDDNISDISTVIIALNETLKGISNKTLTHDERVEMTTSFVENLTKLLQNKESTKLSDEDLQEALDYNIVSMTKAKNIDGISIRIVRFDGSSELFGTLERKWTYIQWWNDEEAHAQIIISKGAEVVEDFLVIKNNGESTLTLAGYLTMYKPFPVFLSTWQLKDNKWSKTNLFSKSIIANDVWELKITDNELVVESKSKDEINVEINQQSKEFVVYSEVNQKKNIEFKFEGEEIMMK